MAHIRDHCETPRRTWFRPIGSVWACSCGELWRLNRTWGGPAWDRIDYLKGSHR